MLLKWESFVGFVMGTKTLEESAASIIRIKSVGYRH